MPHERDQAIDNGAIAWVAAIIAIAIIVIAAIYLVPRLQNQSANAATSTESSATLPTIGDGVPGTAVSTTSME